jgi:hypothetical protein
MMAATAVEAVAQATVLTLAVEAVLVVLEEMLHHQMAEQAVQEVLHLIQVLL